LAYKNALQFVADNYSNTEEGKSARNTNRPNSVTRKKWSLVMRSQSYKILYQVSAREDVASKLLKKN
jgi:hypothetical protein